MKNYISISEVEAVTVGRTTTGQDELDWLYGMSEFPAGNTWGMPVGKISTWVGEGGVGKSRLAINVAKNKVKEGKKVLYFQNEVDLPTLASWVNDDSLSNFYCSSSTDLSDQIKAILELAPDIVFVDSINLIDGYGNGNDGVIREIARAYRGVLDGTQTHVIFLCQLNKDGSAKGSSSLKHLPDTQFLLTNEPKGCFRVSFGKSKPKHRYGRVSEDYYGIWKHNDRGVEAISKNRMKDNRWPKGRPEIKEEHLYNGVPINLADYLPLPKGPEGDFVPLREIPKPMPPMPTAKVSAVQAKVGSTQRVEDGLSKASDQVRDIFFTNHPEQAKDFYKKYPQLKPSIFNPLVPYGNWGLLGRVLSNVFQK